VYKQETNTLSIWFTSKARLLKQQLFFFKFSVGFVLCLPLSLNVFHLEEWERELVAELHDYEVVGEQKPNKRDVWEQEIEEIEELLKDGTDLK
jgi:hypothetical protein